MNSQPPEKQQAMHLCFENLMEGIERNLLTKNRDRYVCFTYGLSVLFGRVSKGWRNIRNVSPMADHPVKSSKDLFCHPGLIYLF